ncbi:MAG TPA: hypothetical protein GXX40_01115 [Firmicutes bacterium]|nr:hypothetical protein [Bacillota bacterium]
MRQTKEKPSEGINLSVSLLARYPEIATIKFTPKKRTLRLSFLVNGEINARTFRRLSTRLEDAIGAYASLKAKKPRCVRIQMSATHEVSLVEVERDVQTIDREEISLITSLLSDYFGKRMMTDEQELQPAVAQEEMVLQEEIIEEMLDSIRQAGARKGFIAMRDEGQVVVFNK